jgi:hypothetical protein
MVKVPLLVNVPLTVSAPPVLIMMVAPGSMVKLSTSKVPDICGKLPPIGVVGMVASSTLLGTEPVDQLPPSPQAVPLRPVQELLQIDTVALLDTDVVHIPDTTV